MKASIEYYKIRNIKTGLFSSGGAKPAWKKFGKIWQIGQLKLHLRLVGEGNRGFGVYKDCEIVTFTIADEPAKVKLEELVRPLEEEISVRILQGKL